MSDAMRVGIKYCGGCNPRYDRVAFVQALADALPEAKFLYGPAAGGAQVLLMVCGCSARCASPVPAENDGRTDLWLDCAPPVPDLVQRIRMSVPKSTSP